MDIKTIHKFKNNTEGEFVCTTKLHVIEVVARLDSAFECRNEMFLFNMGISYDTIKEIIEEKTYIESIEYDTYHNTQWLKEGTKKGVLIMINLVNTVNKKRERIKRREYLFYRNNSPELF
tara:strand:- start:535 stop:894 length:360 start_codon:yes stop_codon:yes gene_type:complete